MSLVAGLAIGYSFLPTLLLAVVTAVVFNPVYKFIDRKFKWLPPVGAAIATLVSVGLLVFIPILAIGYYAFQQLSQLDLVSIEEYLGNTTLLNQFLPNNSSDLLNLELTSLLQSDLQNYIQPILNYLLRIGNNLVEVAAKLVLFLFVFVSSLVNQQSLVKTIKDLLPFTLKTNSELVQTAHKSVFSMSISFVAGALAQAVAAYMILQIFSIPNALLLTIVTFVCAVLPIGSGIVLLPLGVFKLATGSILPGIIILIYTAVVVSSLDNIVRSAAGAKSLQIDSTLVLIGIFLGIVSLGLVGLFVGPAVVALVVKLIQIYLSQK